ncbi:PhzF family phenazine biosynthesis protein [Nocardioides sp. JQ2195]|uniref:PhzF family phenazine biosynthesis protein n=1 Tax=Nocardioides sp. JQ2195 TaxID=2592334 RepID=UPI00143EA044|nr:PhzF family phenazine biosynthesis protein [Nocardioides sp. JQ2195]QIX25357.1 PhzF family phenazine biosynthesis protein [Nocardioides sp. JQ2195]
MTTFDFSQVDVFASGPLTGNPVAVVHDAVGLTDEQMAAFASWTNLSETTFLLPPTDPSADYRLRIFTPAAELPFAGHPTLGSAHAWLEQGGNPAGEDEVVQECGIGLVSLRRDGAAWAFRAPGFLRSGPVDEETLARAVSALGVPPERVRASSWIDNGPGWMGLLLESAEDVLALDPDHAAIGELDLGVIGPHSAGGPADFEVRAFCPELAVPEDPVTGSLNAGFAVWLVEAGLAPADYTVRQGTALGRAGDVRITTDAVGDQWVGGTSHTVIRGSLTI